MKKYTHAWLAFMAIKRLETTKINDKDQKYANNLITWFKNHKDDVTQGAWYPDMIIKDMASSHVLKITPSDEAENKFKKLPTSYLNYQYGKSSPLKKKSFTVEKNDNLPDRCESIAHSVIDHLKMQESENKGSPVSPTDNQIALLLFMLSHYVADAHMPFHCDSRRFSEGKNLHGHIESKWDKKIRQYYRIDEDNERFYYDSDGYPLMKSGIKQAYQNSFLRTVDDKLDNRKLIMSWGAKNNNVWDFMSAICQHSYLLSYHFIPDNYDHTNITLTNWKSLGTISFDEFNVAVFSDTIDSIARVWLKVWRRYLKWERKQRAKK
ncbi:MAG: hypothetical protein GQ536_08600 [Candidatus Aminicenantes bacterium]|nr:hypothetical protein [Candidatus Aminicenantes bacterium]